MESFMEKEKNNISFDELVSKTSVEMEIKKLEKDSPPFFFGIFIIFIMNMHIQSIFPNDGKMHLLGILMLILFYIRCSRFDNKIKNLRKTIKKDSCSDK